MSSTSTSSISNILLEFTNKAFLRGSQYNHYHGLDNVNEGAKRGLLYELWADDGCGKGVREQLRALNAKDQDVTEFLESVDEMKLLESAFDEFIDKMSDEDEKYEEEDRENRIFDILCELDELKEKEQTQEVQDAIDELEYEMSGLVEDTDDECETDDDECLTDECDESEDDDDECPTEDDTGGVEGDDDEHKHDEDEDDELFKKMDEYVVDWVDWEPASDDVLEQYVQKTITKLVS